MRAPGDHAISDDTPSGDAAKAASSANGAHDVGRLKRRADFLHVGRGRRWHGKGLTLQTALRAKPNADASTSAQGPRVGLTLTKKVGCAVVRNRARRRLREALRLSPELPLRPDHDYVMVGRIEAIRLSFEDLKQDIARAAGRVHEAAFGKPRAGRGNASEARGGRHKTERTRAADPSGVERTKPTS